MMSVTSPALAVGEADVLPARARRREVVAAHVRQHQVLLVRDAHLVEGIAFGEVGDRVHLLGAWRRPECRRSGLSEMVTMA